MEERRITLLFMITKISIPASSNSAFWAGRSFKGKVTKIWKRSDSKGVEQIRATMFGMIKNSLFGATEETEYKLLSTETKVSFAPFDNQWKLWLLLFHAYFTSRISGEIVTVVLKLRLCVCSDPHNSLLLSEASGLFVLDAVWLNSFNC